MCHIPTLHHYDIFPPGGNLTGGNMPVGNRFHHHHVVLDDDQQYHHHHQMFPGKIIWSTPKMST